MRAQLVPIEVHSGVAIHAIELNADDFLFQSLDARNVLRYQPIPPGKKPPPAPLGLCMSGLLSMLQSCGRSTDRHDASANDGASAPLGSPGKNFQPASAANSLERGLEFAALIERGTKHASSAVKRIDLRYKNFIRPLRVWTLPAFCALRGGRDAGVPVARNHSRITADRTVVPRKIGRPQPAWCPQHGQRSWQIPRKRWAKQNAGK